MHRESRRIARGAARKNRPSLHPDRLPPMDPASFLSALLAIVVIDLVLAGDNAIVIALAARGLPARLQKRAIVWGAVGAVVVRSLMTVDRRLAAPHPGTAARRRPDAALDRVPAAPAGARAGRPARAGADDVLGRDADDRRRRRGDGPRQRAGRRRRGARQLPARRRRARSSAFRSSSGAARSSSRSSIASRASSTSARASSSGPRRR